MDRREARRLAGTLHKAGIDNVRLVEYIEDGEMEILVWSNSRTLRSPEEVHQFLQQFGES